MHIIELDAIAYEQYKIFLTMMSTGCFNMAYGKVTLNFADGSLQNIVREEMVFRKERLASQKT